MPERLTPEEYLGRGSAGGTDHRVFNDCDSGDLGELGKGPCGLESDYGRGNQMRDPRRRWSRGWRASEKHWYIV